MNTLPEACYVECINKTVGLCVPDHRAQCGADPRLRCDRPVGGGDGERRWSEGDSCF